MLFLVLSMLAPLVTASPPKVILMLIADDYGWWNIEMDGHNVAAHTPNLHKLANAGVRLDRYYVYKYCSPTRSSLLTGRLPIHVNQNNEGNTLSSSSGADIRMTTLAQKLKSANPPYRTHLLGKWHCGARSAANLPINRGYDSHIGFLKGAEDHYTQMSDFNGYSHKYIDLWQDHGPASNSLNGTYSVFRDTEQALRIIDSHDFSLPLYLDVRFQTAHAPYQVPVQYLDMSIENTCRRTYHAMATAMDDGIGNITNALRAKGHWEDTLVVFMADNGAPTHSGQCGNNYPLRGGKTSDFEGGVRVSAFLSGGYVPARVQGTVHRGLMHVADWYATLSTLVGVDPTDNATAPQWKSHLTNWNCGDELIASKVDTNISLDSCLQFCSAYSFVGHWTAGVPTCRCYTGCAGQATQGENENEVYAKTDGVPPIDSLDQWASLMTPFANSSARDELPLSYCTNLKGASDDCVSSASGLGDVSLYDQGAFIGDGGRWKIVFGDQHGLGFFTGLAHPNGTADYKDAGCVGGCLFDLNGDPTEHVNLRGEHADVFQRLKTRMEEVGRTIYQTSHTDAPTKCLSEVEAAVKYSGHLGPQCSPGDDALIV